MNTDLIVITGPTASGKTKLAVRLANELNGEIISADSRQVYRGMDIGTGKDLAEYVINGIQVPYHLIDIREAGEAYNLFDYQIDFLNAYNKIKQKRKLPLLTGGTGLYIEAVLKNYTFTSVPVNSVLRNTLSTYSLNDLRKRLTEINRLNIVFDTSTIKRLIRAIEICEYLKENSLPETENGALNYQIFCINVERNEIWARIKNRLSERLKVGLVDEVKHLLQRGIGSERIKYYGLEYKYVMLYLEGKINFKQLNEKLYVAIRQYAKRQMTWFRRMERQGYELTWLDGSMDIDELANKVIQLLHVG